MEPTVFFDLDGTLIDPKAGITGSIRHALERLGVAPVPSPDELTWCIGPPLLESLESLLDADRAPLALRYYRERYGDLGIYECTLYPGIRDALSLVRGAGRRLYVASSKPGVYVERILDHFDLGGFFEGVFGSELDGTRTKKTDLLRFALERTGTKGTDAIMVGDRKHDIQGALHNAIVPIGVLYGYGTAEELAEAGAARIANTPADLFETIFD
ncbi:MAG TPA: HAD family hydrolase [Deltaproteobacteria bacterium]|nr:HAD family hydrolase [Deltaproteobacteria bacterium]